MSSAPGRKPNISESLVISSILKMKDEIFLENGKLKSKTDEVWENISTDLDGKLSSRTLYSKMCNAGFRKNLNLYPDPCKEMNVRQNDTVISIDIEEIRSDEEEDVIEFTLFVKREEYEKLFITKEYKRNECTRSCLRLDPGKWEHWISDEIWDSTKILCGFNFRGHYLTQDGRAGKMEGT